MNESLEIYGPNMGLGTILCFLSILMHIKKPIVLKVDRHQLIYDEIKTILSIPDDKIIIKKDNHVRQESFVPDDHIKYFSPYIKPTELKLFGNSYPVRNHRRPCVALGVHNESLSTLPDPLPDTFPYTRQYCLDDYSKIFKHFSQAGYDVVSLNSEKISLEQKIFILNETCDCVIAYEGGLAHLAHVLQIPCIILPWRYGPEGQPAAAYAAERYNLDRRSYFPKSIDELLSWSPQETSTKIDDLYQGRGNNLLLSNELLVNKDTLEVTLLDKKNSYRPWLDAGNINFIKENLTEFVVGG